MGIRFSIKRKGYVEEEDIVICMPCPSTRSVSTNTSHEPTNPLRTYKSDIGTGTGTNETNDLGERSTLNTARTSTSASIATNRINTIDTQRTSLNTTATGGPITNNTRSFKLGFGRSNKKETLRTYTTDTGRRPSTSSSKQTHTIFTARLDTSNTPKRVPRTNTGSGSSIISGVGSQNRKVNTALKVSNSIELDKNGNVIPHKKLQILDRLPSSTSSLNSYVSKVKEANNFKTETMILPRIMPQPEIMVYTACVKNDKGKCAKGQCERCIIHAPSEPGSNSNSCVCILPQSKKSSLSKEEKKKKKGKRSSIRFKPDLISSGGSFSPNYSSVTIKNSFAPNTFGPNNHYPINHPRIGRIARFENLPRRDCDCTNCGRNSNWEPWNC